MIWIIYEIFDVDKDLSEELSAILTSFGANSVSLSKDNTKDVFSTNTEQHPLWDKLKVTSIFPENAFSLEQIRNNIKTKLNINVSDHYQKLLEQDWVELWQKNTKPIIVDDQLIISPSHRKQNTPDKLQVLLDPGMAFGTGHHPTTLLCLKWLLKNQIENKTVIDYGCGSGILAITAHKLGAKTVWAIDNDPQALQATKANCQKNNIFSNNFIISTKAEPKKPVDIIVANIYSEVLIKLKPLFSEKLKPNGILLLTGILLEQLESVMDKYSSNYNWITKYVQNEWVLIIGKKMQII